MANISVTYTFSNGTTADGTQVNQNFTDIINGTSDGTKSFSIAALTLASTLTANGNVVIGASSANTVTLNGSIAASVPFSANTSWDIGSSTLGAKSLYLGGSSTFTLRLIAATQAASYTLTFPAAIATSTNGALFSDTSGNLSWGPIVYSAADITTAGKITLTNGGVTLRNVSDGLESSGGAGNIFYPATNNNAGLSGLPIGSSARTMGVKTGAGGATFPLVVSQTPANHGLIIVRGYVGSMATAIGGEGFTASRQGAGQYNITYSANTFYDAPVCVGAAVQAGNLYCFFINSSSTGVLSCEVSYAPSNTPSDIPFTFIAFGQRGA